jgi:hypothetical protein
MNLKRRNTSSTDAVNHQRSLWLNKDGALLIRKAQEEERKKKEKEKVQRAARKVQTAMRKELATEAAQSGMQLVYEEPNEENYPIICARTNYRNYIAENDDATDGNAASCAHIISGFVGINFAKMMGEITLKNVYTTTK